MIRFSKPRRCASAVLAVPRRARRLLVGRVAAERRQDRLQERDAQGALARSAARPDAAVARFALRGRPAARSRASSFQRRPVPRRRRSPPGGRADRVGDVRIERAGTQRWLVINLPPEQLWPQVRDFWQESGFLLTQDRANLPASWKPTGPRTAPSCRRTSSATRSARLLDSLYSTGERDRFRTRLERTPTAAPRSTSATAAWSRSTPASAEGPDRLAAAPGRPGAGGRIPAPPDGQARRAAGAGRKRAAVAAGGAEPHLARRARVDGQPAARCRSTRASTAPGAASAWRWTAPASRSKTATAARALYFVRYVDRPTPDERSRASSASCSAATRRTTSRCKYRISAQEPGRRRPRSRCSTRKGAPETSANAGKRIVQVHRRRPEVAAQRRAGPTLRRVIRFYSLGSGSTGNATVVQARGGTRTTHLLVDCGFSLRELDARLARPACWPSRSTRSSSPTSTATTSAARVGLARARAHAGAG